MRGGQGKARRELGQEKKLQLTDQGEKGHRHRSAKETASTLTAGGCNAKRGRGKKTKSNALVCWKPTTPKQLENHKKMEIRKKTPKENGAQK